MGDPDLDQLAGGHAGDVDGARGVAAGGSNRPLEPHRSRLHRLEAGQSLDQLSLTVARDPGDAEYLPLMDFRVE